jgi:hypothetical protein
MESLFYLFFRRCIQKKHITISNFVKLNPSWIVWMCTTRRKQCHKIGDAWYLVMQCQRIAKETIGNNEI